MRRLFRIENLFALGMWAVSLALAYFLVGLGGLVVADLPQVDRAVDVADYVDPEAAARVAAAEDAAADALAETEAALQTARLILEARQADTAAERDTFEAWIATRTATGDGARDEEVVRRTERLATLREAERQARAEGERLAARAAGLRDRPAALAAEEAALRQAAFGPYERAVFVREAKVFGLRLALTLPLLVVALWAIRTRRGSPLWPLWRGFALFAAFTFFVELVPYLPSYGGYVHYGVGAIVTVVLGAWLIRAARRHLARRAEAAARSESERRRSISYEDALRKTAADTCPSCDRTLRTTDGRPVNFCVHCGMRLYDACPACGVRRLVFFPFCMNCGAPSPGPESVHRPPSLPDDTAAA